MSQIGVIMGPERRRRWRAEEKLAILSEAFAPGAVVKDVCRRRDVSTSLIYLWRRQALSAQSPTGFTPVVITDHVAPEPVPAPRGPIDVIVVDLGGGRRVRISVVAPADLVTATLKALK